MSKQQLLQNYVFSLIKNLDSFLNIEQFYNKLHVILSQLSVEKYMIFSDSDLDKFYSLKINLISSIYKSELKIFKDSYLVADINRSREPIQQYKIKGMPRISRFYFIVNF